MKKIGFIALAVFMCTAMLSGCAAPLKAEDLMRGVKPAPVAAVTLNDSFKNAAANFSVELLKNPLPATLQRAQTHSSPPRPFFWRWP
ncbi:MAG: hypothetical protein FWD58_03550 [Firmicutes bacterium]|nr:hypothetical protein [Bacillota bacterium]